MMTNIQFFILLFHFLFQWINSEETQQYYHWSRSTKIKNFHKYSMTKMIKKKARFKLESNALNHDDCLQSCTSTTDCVSLNVLRQLNDTLSCEYFSSANGHLLQKENSTFYTKNAPRCAGYCEQFSYLPVCGNCHCVNLCDSKFTHYCDCASVTNTSSKDCSRAVLAFGNLPTSGLYHVDNGRKTVIVMCQFFRYNFVETLWVTIYRRLESDTTEFKKTRLEHIKRFNQPFDDYFMMGYEEIEHFTSTGTSMTLGVLLLTFSGENEYAEYDDFTFTAQEDGSYRVEHSDYRCNFCTNNHFVRRKTEHEKSCPEYDLLRICPVDDSIINLAHNTIRYRSITLLLRPKHYNAAEPKRRRRTIYPDKLSRVISRIPSRIDTCLKFTVFTRMSGRWQVFLAKGYSERVSIFYNATTMSVIFRDTKVDCAISRNTVHRVQLSVRYIPPQNQMYMELHVNGVLIGEALINEKPAVEVNWLHAGYRGNSTMNHIYLLTDMYVNGKRIL